MSAPTDSFMRPITTDLGAGNWFVGAGFGVFVHWDHASQQELEVSWPMVGRSIIPGVDQVEDTVTIEQYQSSAATFDPRAWDAAALARMAKEAGATYVVFTTRHHAGYDMFFSDQSDFGIKTSAFGRDITREYVEALRAEGLKVGLYYSLPDWSHPDYPAFTQEDLPYGEEHWPAAGQEEFAEHMFALDRNRRSSPEEWSRYLDYMRGQLTELLTNYGTIDLLWFDGGWERSAAEWGAPGLRRLIKSLQPDVLINDRLPGQGDYTTPEQSYPTELPEGPWELCLTIGEMWGHRTADTKTKSARSLVTTLVEVTSRGGNLLLNVGPRGDGSLDPSQVGRFEEIAEWMKIHRESVVDVSPTAGVDFYGPTTAREGRVYLHLVMAPREEVIVRGLPVRRITGIRVLATGEQLAYEVGNEVHGEMLPGTEPTGELRITAPTQDSGALMDVIAIDFAPRRSE